MDGKFEMPPLKPDQIEYLRKLHDACKPLQPDDPRMDEVIGGPRVKPAQNNWKPGIDRIWV